MGVTFDLVLADAAELEQVAAFALFSPRDTISTKLLDSVTLAQLHTLILPISYDEAMRLFDDDPAFDGGDDGPWIYALPGNLVARLAGLTDVELERTARGWAETEEIKIQQVDECFLIDLLWDMRVLAQRSRRVDKMLYLRIAL